VSSASSRLGYLFKHAQQRMAQLNSEALKAYGINGRELAALLVLTDHEPPSQQEAAERLGVDRTTMVALLDGLETKALVTRRPQAGDRRRNVVELTGKGRDTLRDATAASDEAERVLLAALTEPEADQLRKLLQAVVVQRLRFRATHLAAVRNGSKRVTMRFRDPVQVGPALLVFGSDDEVGLPGRIVSTVAKPVGRITDDEARADGFAHAGDVLPGLRDYYPSLRPDDEIVIVRFEVDAS
jgi:DNA-binding MarR family transcriptional regulator